MATSKEFVTYFLEKTADIPTIRIRPMMSEYLVYYQDIYFGVLADDRFLIRITDIEEVQGFPQELPYEGAKPMYVIDLESPLPLKTIIEKTCLSLQRPKKKANRK